MVLRKTELGQAAFKARSHDFSPAQRSAYILFDGVRQTQRVLLQTEGIGFTADDVEHLMALGYLEAADAQGAAGVATAPEATQSLTVGAPAVKVAAATAGDSADFDPRTAYHVAYPLATKLAAGLGMRGFLLNLAVERATSFEELVAVAPKLRDAVGEEKFTPLRTALGLF
jgi:hypothetical protein